MARFPTAFASKAASRQYFKLNGDELNWRNVCQNRTLPVGIEGSGTVACSAGLGAKHQAARPQKSTTSTRWVRCSASGGSKKLSIELSPSTSMIASCSRRNTTLGAATPRDVFKTACELRKEGVNFFDAVLRYTQQLKSAGNAWASRFR